MLTPTHSSQEQRKKYTNYPMFILKCSKETFLSDLQFWQAGKYKHMISPE